MLHIILLILKIILLIVLGILGLALLLILLVLFAPIKYKANIKYKDKPKIFAKVSFLFLSVKVLFDKETNVVNKDICIFGIKLGKKNNKNNKNNSDSNINELEVDSGYSLDGIEEFEDYFDDEDIKALDVSKKDTISQKDDSLVDKDKDKETIVPTINESAENITKDIKEIAYIVKSSSNSGVLEDFEASPSDKENINSIRENKKADGFIIKIKNIINIIKNAFDKTKTNIEKTLDDIHLKLEKIKKKINRVKKFWNMKCTVKTRAYLKKYLKGVIKHIMPRKIKGYIRYGLGDPCKTGQLTGYISLIPLFYQKGFDVYPDFYDKVIDVDVMIKGKIYLGYIVRIVLKPYIWKCIKMAKKI